MKINKIFISGCAMLALTACNDFLDVEPATDTANTEFVYNSQSEINTALNGVYAKLLSNDTFGGRLYSDFMLNSDVDFATNNNEALNGERPRMFDNRADNGAIDKLWNNLYGGVETANEFIYNLKGSSLYEEKMKSVLKDSVTMETEEVPDVTAITQMMGEAKVIRAMFYHELLSYFGDIPFTLKASYETDNLLPEVTAREEVSKALIEDLQEAAEYMYSDQDAAISGSAPERISKEAAYAMIARLALQAGGYSLNHDAGDQSNYKMTRPNNYQDYYKIARDYAKKVIDANGHKLTKSYRDVFVDECNFIVTSGDDAIFELPFAKETSSNWGYSQGPKSDVDATVETDYTTAAWGKTNGGVNVSALYRMAFDDSDLRRDYICGLWNYNSLGLPGQDVGYALNNNKWSKLWNTMGLGKSTEGNTGINFAYIRYADVLLMFAEAENEINGPTAEAQEALKTVRKRAFDAADWADKVDTYVATASADKNTFLKAVLDERKFEFAGENMRWKDLVRNNLYSEKLFYTFLTYLSVAQDQGGNAPYMDMCEEYEGILYSQLMPSEVNYCYVQNYDNPNFPNNNVYMLYIANEATTPQQKPQDYFTTNGIELTAVAENTITGSGSKEIVWGTSDVTWWDDGQGQPKNQIYYSLLGYIRMDNRGDLFIVDNGTAKRFNNVSAASVSSLPAVRYILPYPEEAISRSGGLYKNYYGY